MLRAFAKVGKSTRPGIIIKRHGSGGHGHGPQVPEFHDKLGSFCLVACYVWVMYRAKENKGQLFGLYQPWLHPHDHVHHHYVEQGVCGDNMPKLEEEEEHDDEEEEE